MEESSLSRPIGGRPFLRPIVRTLALNKSIVETLVPPNALEVFPPQTETRRIIRISLVENSQHTKSLLVLQKD